MRKLFVSNFYHSKLYNVIETKLKYLVNLCSTEEIGDTEEEIKYALDLSGLNGGFVINFPPDSIIAKVKKIRRPH